MFLRNWDTVPAPCPSAIGLSSVLPLMMLVAYCQGGLLHVCLGSISKSVCTLSRFLLSLWLVDCPLFRALPTSLSGSAEGSDGGRRGKTGGTIGGGCDSPLI